MYCFSGEKNSYNRISHIEFGCNYKNYSNFYSKILWKDKAYEENNKKKGEDKEMDDGLKVKYLMKRKKRLEIIETFQKRKSSKIDLSVNTATLDRIGSILNRNSQVYIGNQMEEMKKQEERKLMMKEIIEKEMNKKVWKLLTKRMIFFILINFYHSLKFFCLIFIF